MASHRVELGQESRHLGDLAGRLFIPLAGVGVVALVIVLAVGLLGEDKARFYQSWLVNFMFFLSIALGGLFFTIMHHLTRAGWSVTLRRIGEALSANLWLMALLFIPLLLGLLDHKLFKWNGDEKYIGDAIVDWKRGYLNQNFFIIRAVIYFAIWIGLSQFMFRTSVAQDASGDVALTRRMQKIAPVSIILFGLSITFAAIDWLMTLDPHFFSTIWGVYYFAGSAAAFYACAIVLVTFLQSTGRLQRAVTIEHKHDLGKLMFAFGTVFWAYIAFSQYMLIWYAAIPEETEWYQPRASGLSAESALEAGLSFIPGAWNGWTLALIVMHFAAPFVLLVSRLPKRRGPLLCAGALWMLGMCWYDLYWLIMPVFYKESPATALAGWWIDLLCFVGMGGVFLALLIHRMRERSLIPEKDPRLHESLAFENA